MSIIDALYTWMVGNGDLYQGIGHRQALDEMAEAAVALAKQRRCAHRQQTDRGPDTVVGTWAIELAFYEVAMQRQTCYCNYQIDPVGSVAWT